MKTILDYRCYVSLDGEHYHDTSIKHHLVYTEPIMDKLSIMTTFDELVESVKNGVIMNAKITHTLFGHKPMVELSLCWDNHYITKRNFKPIYVKKVWEELKEDKSISTLAELLPANDFIEYVKDRGIYTINLN